MAPPAHGKSLAFDLSCGNRVCEREHGAGQRARARRSHGLCAECFAEHQADLVCINCKNAPLAHGKSLAFELSWGNRVWERGHQVGQRARARRSNGMCADCLAEHQAGLLCTVCEMAPPAHGKSLAFDLSCGNRVCERGHQAG